MKETSGLDIPGERIIRIAVAGAAGRMGKSVLELAAKDERFHIVAALTKRDCPELGSTLRFGRLDVTFTDHLTADCDVLIDFTVADGTMAWLEVCRQSKLPLVIGATGHSTEQLRRINEAAATIPIIKATNFSVGIHAILRTLNQLTRDLGEGYDVEIVEAHHRNKVDAPSGTAITLLESIAAARGLRVEQNTVHGRHGQTGVRPASQIGVHSLRMGEVIGEHEIHLSGPGETITIRHVAHSRETFATGALRAARWIVSQSPGLYGMGEVLEAAKGV